MAVVSISRQVGAGGTVVGRLVAKKLGFKLIDRDLLALVAQKANVSTEWVEQIEQEASDSLMGLIAELASTISLARPYPGQAHEFDEAKYLAFLKRVISEIAAHGQAVILGRGAQFILKDDPEAIKVLLVAEWEERVRFMMANFGLERTKAESITSREEKKRLNFLRSFGVAEPYDPKHYHLTIHTGRVGLEGAADLICQLAGQLAGTIRT